MGDSISGDKVEGDKIAGDKVAGNKVEVGSVSNTSGPVNVAGGNIFQRINNFFTSDTEQQRAFRNRQNILQLVWNTWIEGVLKKSLYNEMLIELGMETQPDAVEHSWDMVIQMPDREPRMVTPGTSMIELFNQASGALLILGEPGSGKTTMLLELARQAIERAHEEPTQPVPVVFNLSSWTTKVTIADWLVDELRGKYYISPKIGRPWIDNDELLLLFDGLDEVKAENRDQCVQAINAYREEYNVPVAICSRRREYEVLTAHLKLCCAVLIQPLTDQQVDEYLQSATNGLTAVTQFVNRDPELRDFAQTPLVLSILVLTYQGSPPEDIKSLGTESDYRNRLFDNYIAQMFRRRGSDFRYTKEQTISWLAWLARSMVEHGQSLFQIEDIQPSRLAFSKNKARLIVGLIVGLSFGLIGGLIGGLIVGLIVGLIFGLIFGLRDTEAKPTEEISFSRQGFQKGLNFGVIFGLISGLIFGPILGLGVEMTAVLTIGPIIGPILGLLDGLGDRLSAGLIFGLIFGPIFGLLGGLRRYSAKKRSVPEAGIKGSLKNFLFVGLIIGLGIGLSFEQIFGLMSGLFLGLMSGLFFGLPYGGEFLLKHSLSRFLLWRLGHIPWNLVPFLDYCTDRIFLRRVGGGYIFIHRMLMEHFAAMATDEAGVEGADSPLATE